MGIITTATGRSVIVVYLSHVRGATHPDAYRIHKDAFDLFVSDLENTGRQGGFISEPRRYDYVIAGGEHRFLRKPVGGGGPYLQALVGDYNARIAQHNLFNRTDHKLALDIDNFEPGMSEELRYLSNNRVIGPGDLRFVTLHYLGKHLSQHIDRYETQPGGSWPPSDHRLRQEIDKDLQRTLDRLNSAGLRIGGSPLEVLEFAYWQIFNERPNLRDPKFWKVFSFPWLEPVYANDRIPYPLIRMGNDLNQLRDSRVAEGVVNDYMRGDKDGLLVYGLEHGLGQMVEIYERLKAEGLSPRIYSLSSDNTSYLSAEALETLLSEASRQSADARKRGKSLAELIRAIPQVVAIDLSRFARSHRHLACQKKFPFASTRLPTGLNANGLTFILTYFAAR